MNRTLLAVAILALSTPARAQTDAPADTSETRQFLDELQRADDAFFDPELAHGNAALRDSLVTSFEQLGYEEFRDEAAHAQRRFGWDWGPFSGLWSYNRVEGLVPAGYLRLRPRGPRGMSLRGDLGYATGSHELRYRARLELPWRGSGHGLRLDYADQVVPFGANRPQWSSLRALVGAADERDYLHRRGGGASLYWRSESNRAELGYEAARELSAAAHTDFAFFGTPARTNPSVDEGIDRAVVARVVVGDEPLSPFVLRLSHRVAGGGLAGDFDYQRSDAKLEWHAFVRRFELQTWTSFTHTTAGAPLQQKADVGGVDVVRGYPRRYHVGRSSVALRAELPIPYDLLRRSRIPLLRSTGLQLVPWADAARVFDGDDEAWIHSLGAGVQKYLGGFGRAANLRLDAAFPVGPDRPADVVFYLRFAGN